MNYRGYNDYELLYLINGGTEEAREIMIEKYQGLIYKKLHKYYYKSFDKDDLYQELQMVLLKAIDKYQENDQKTFTKFLELLIDHKLVDLFHIH